MRVTVEFRRPARRTLLALVLVALLVVPGTALASHLFPDVGNAHPFHTEITAIAGAGVTAGFNDGGYHPSDAVTRQAMAAFMHRGFGRLAHISQSLLNPTIDVNAGAEGSADVEMMEITMTVPGAGNGFSPMQMVYLHARIELVGSFSTSVKGCPCTFNASIVDVTGATLSPSNSATFESVANSSRAHSFTADWAVVVPPGERTFRVRVSHGDRETTTNQATFSFSPTSTFTAMTFPFGPDGTNELQP